MKYAIGLEYDGSRFCGWQSQADGCGVQDALEKALSTVADEPVAVHAAGRTDAGVHAVAQVVHFRSDVSRQPTAWVRGVNSVLPETMSVLWAKPVADNFHARHCAHDRTYRYVLMCRRSRPGLLAKRIGWVHVPLDGEAMTAAARHLVGEHDFSTFRAASCQSPTAERRLEEVSVEHRGEECFVFSFRANAFLHHMVRNMVATLVYVGRGKHPPEWVGEILAAKDRDLAAPTFAPDGLYLTSVGYNASWKLPPVARPVPIFGGDG